MTDTLLILSGDPDGDALLLQRNGMAQRGDADALAAAGNGPLALVLPGQQVRAFLTDMPAKVRAADRDSIARFAHEDRIATDMDALHVVIGRADGDSPGAVQTLMVARADLQAAIERFDPASVFADFDLLSGFGNDPVRLLDRVVTPGPMGEAVDADWSDVAGTVHDDGTLSRALFARLDSGDALDLRSGPYRRRAQIQAGPWGRVAAMFVVCAALALGAGLADSRATQLQARALSDQARQSYQSVTGQPAPADLARAVRRAGPSDADPTAFLALSDVLFRSLSQHPDIRVERLSYDSTENALRLRLLYPGFDAPGALERTANQTGAVFVMGGVREQSGRYVGDASLRLEGTS